MTTTLIDVEELTEKVIGCAIEVHRIVGPGLLESVYQECMIIEMRREHLRVDSERHIPVDYKGQRISGGLKLDLLVDGCVLVELKAVERLHPIHLAQVITYLKLTGCPAGLLMNFNATTLRAGLRRLYYPNRYVKKTSCVPLLLFKSRREHMTVSQEIRRSEVVLFLQERISCPSDLLFKSRREHPTALRIS